MRDLRAKSKLSDSSYTISQAATALGYSELFLLQRVLEQKQSVSTLKEGCGHQVPLSSLKEALDRGATSVEIEYEDPEAFDLDESGDKPEWRKVLDFPNLKEKFPLSALYISRLNLEMIEQANRPVKQRRVRSDKERNIEDVQAALEYLSEDQKRVISRMKRINVLEVTKMIVASINKIRTHKECIGESTVRAILSDLLKTNPNLLKSLSQQK